MTPDVETLDPGIVALVELLQANGFTTTDSGDGVTKLAAGWDPDEAMPWLHVFMTITPQEMISESRRLRGVMLNAGYRVTPQGEPGWSIQASFDPMNDSAILALIGEK